MQRLGRALLDNSIGTGFGAILKCFVSWLAGWLVLHAGEVFKMANLLSEMEMGFGSTIIFS